MPMRTHLAEAAFRQTGPFQARPHTIPPRDIQLLMAWPFFSLSKSRRTQPIHLTMGQTRILVEPRSPLGIATIWDADILIWLTSQIVEAGDRRTPCSSRIVASPHQILASCGRGTGQSSYDRLRAAFTRLAHTQVSAVFEHHGRSPARDWSQPFCWISQYDEAFDAKGRSAGIEVHLSRQLFDVACDPRQVLTLDPGYFRLTGGFARWLYRIVRKHGGRQAGGWSFELDHLHQKSGSLSSPRRFAFEIRSIVRHQALPGYTLSLEPGPSSPRLRFRPARPGRAGMAGCLGTFQPGDNL